VAVPTSIAAVVSYLLTRWVWSGAPIAAGAALRDTSAILVAIALSAVAVPLLRFA
jgi:hypothetical protein